MAFLLCLATLASMGAGCGGDLRSKIGGGSTTTASASASPEEVARAVNLRASDFPYLRKGEREQSSAEDRKSQREFEDCVGETRLESELANVESPRFTGSLGGEFLEFSSNVEVFGSEAGAERVASLLRSHRVYACFSRLLKPTLERDEAGSNFELVSVKTSPLPFPDTAIDGGFGYRIAATVASTPESNQLTAYVQGTTPDGRPTLTVYMDILAFVSGRIEVGMTASGGPSPVPRILERNLLRLLQSRAQTEGERLR